MWFHCVQRGYYNWCEMHTHHLSWEFPTNAQKQSSMQQTSWMPLGSVSVCLFWKGNVCLCLGIPAVKSIITGRRPGCCFYTRFIFTLVFMRPNKRQELLHIHNPVAHFNGKRCYFVLVIPPYPGWIVSCLTLFSLSIGLISIQIINTYYVHLRI